MDLIRRDRDEIARWGGMGSKIMAGCGIEEAYVGPSNTGSFSSFPRNAMSITSP